MTNAPHDSAGEPNRSPERPSEPKTTRVEPKPSHTGHKVVAFIVVALIVLHQDNWFWNSEYLVFGIIPITLFYHACISIAASCTWLLATKIAWPVETIQIAKTAEPTIADSKGAQ